MESWCTTAVQAHQRKQSQQKAAQPFCTFDVGTRTIQFCNTAVTVQFYHWSNSNNDVLSLKWLVSFFPSSLYQQYEKVWEDICWVVFLTKMFYLGKEFWGLVLIHLYLHSLSEVHLQHISIGVHQMSSCRIENWNRSRCHFWLPIKGHQDFLQYYAGQNSYVKCQRLIWPISNLAFCPNW